MNDAPEFIIIGAMKCATSTLHEQLARQPGVFMTGLKEPNFFSDDEVYARGIDWYLGLFAGAPPGALRGESSTHYTKLPTHPRAVDRLLRHDRPDRKFIYVMRNPIDRLISQYVHEWSQLVIPNGMGIDRAVESYPELVDYGRYAMQLRPYLDAFGAERVLPVFSERLAAAPRQELGRICRFLGYPGEPAWHEELDARNASRERMRASPWRDRIVEAPVLRQLRRALVPKPVRTWVRGLWTLKQKPQPSAETLRRLTATYDEDLATLGSWLGIRLSCATFKEAVRAGGHDWKAAPGPGPARSAPARAVGEPRP